MGRVFALVFLTTFVLITGINILINLIKKKKEKEEEVDSQSQIWNNRYDNLLYNGDKTWEQPIIWHPYSSFEDNDLGKEKANKAMSQRVLDMPQLSFDQWFTFYTNKPDAWVIEKREYKTFANIPYYTKVNFHTDNKGKEIQNTIYIPTFWKSAEDMRKYREWVEEKYQKGNAAIFDKIRAENMSKLTQYLRQDIDEQRKLTKQELEKYQQRINKEQEEFEKLNKTGVMTLTFGNEAIQIQKERE